jgi:hypothetical protein
MGTIAAKNTFVQETAAVQGGKKITKKIVGAVVLGLLFLLAIGLIAPFINAKRFSGAIRNALESSLGRTVEFEDVHFNLFSGPGFSLENVKISEDPQYGIEAFAYVPVLQARLRVDKLLTGRVQFASLRLVDPSLNLVKNTAGDWNVVSLMERLSAPRLAPLNLFPFLEVSNGRIDFKFGMRKTTLYISETDLSIYPARSGKVYIAFSGSPARTDRAGMGFGHFRGGVNWFLKGSTRGANQLQAEINLDPSNLSELTTLVEGHDIGVHGTVGSRLQFEGPATALKVTGVLRLNDVHRWDLLPSSGEEWVVRLGGNLDLLAHHFELSTQSSQPGQSVPVAMRLHVNDFLTHPIASVVADLNNAPLHDLLPLAKRMGIALPAGADLRGALNGAVGYSSQGGWNGGFVINNAEASLAGSPTIRSASVNATVAAGRLHLGPAIVETGAGGTLRMSGSLSFPDEQANASFSMNAVSVPVLKEAANAWFGAPTALSGLVGGSMTGQLYYSYQPGNSTADQAEPSWAGQLELNDASIVVPGLSAPLRAVQARVNFDPTTCDFERVTATLAGSRLRARYRYNLLAKHTEQVRIEFPRADLADLQNVFAASSRTESLWARFRFFRRAFPAWLSSRNLEGELRVHTLLADQALLGTLNASFLWQGTHLALNNVALSSPAGNLTASGTVDLASLVPNWNLNAKVSDYSWAGGLLNAEGRLTSSGAGQDVLRNLTAEGSFDGEDLSPSTEEVFETASGNFRISFAGGWPNLRLSDIQASRSGDEWLGTGNTESDGRLLINLEHEGEQIRIVSSLIGQPAAAIPTTEPPVSTLGKLKF